MNKILSAKPVVIAIAVVSSLGIGYALGAQPHMNETLTLLRSARAELAARQHPTRADIASVLLA